MMNPKWMQWGWLFFTIAGVVWILPFGIFWIARGKPIMGVWAIALFLLATAVIFAFIPWKYPDVKLWKLMVPPFGMFILCVMLLVYVLTNFKNLAEIQYGLWLFPCFSPFFTLGHKTWNTWNGKMDK